MRTSVISLITVLAIGCGKGEKSEPAPQPEPAPAGSGGAVATPPTTGGDPKAKGLEIFRTRCVPCHGATGTGDGPASASLNPKPRAFGDPEWQASVTDDHIMKIIKYGGAAVGKSAAMPNNPDLSDEAVVAALKDVVRSFKK